MEPYEFVIFALITFSLGVALGFNMGCAIKPSPPQPPPEADEEE